MDNPEMQAHSRGISLEKMQLQVIHRSPNKEENEQGKRYIESQLFRIFSKSVDSQQPNPVCGDGGE